MHIECPSCETENKIEFGENIVCSKCKKSFAGHSYRKFKKPFISATTALIIGAYGAYKADQVFFEENRYPVGIEYEIVDSCVNASRTLMDSYQYIHKTKVCVCALKKTMEEVSYEKLKNSESEFLTRFRSSVATCN